MLGDSALIWLSVRFRSIGGSAPKSTNRANSLLNSFSQNARTGEW